MKETILKKIKVTFIIAIIILISVFLFLSRGYLPFINKNYVSIETASSLASESVGGGNVLSIHRDFFGFIPHYEVIVMQQYLAYKVEINAKTGKIMEIDME